MDHAITLSICVDNPAFGINYQDQAAEVARILRHAADRLEESPAYLDPCSGRMLCLNDANGCRVGHVTPEILDIS
jgi:hypothetical protein